MPRSLIAFLMVVVAAAALTAAPAADLTGTWLGVTQVPDLGEDNLKLELKADGDSYTGMLTDAAAVVIPRPITSVKVDGATLTFNIVVLAGAGEMPVSITLKADGDTLTGSWASDDGNSAPVTLTRQK